MLGKDALATAARDAVCQPRGGIAQPIRVVVGLRLTAGD